MNKTPEQMAELFHEAYERLAPEFGYETREETRQFDPESKNGKLMIATCAAVIAHARPQIEAVARAAALEDAALKVLEWGPYGSQFQLMAEEIRALATVPSGHIVVRANKLRDLIDAANTSVAMAGGSNIVGTERLAAAVKAMSAARKP
jgi:fructose-specific phosphotransferase system component IIB